MHLSEKMYHIVDKEDKEKGKVGKQKPESQISERQAGATKRSGQNILRKAKLQLNKCVVKVQFWCRMLNSCSF